ncbi:hypothetical protein V2G26_002301 [Clonostachys chloroleuca]
MSSPEVSLLHVRRVLIANRGEIACRCIRACKQLNITSVSIYTRSDSTSLHVSEADESAPLKGEGTSAYLDIDDILDIAKRLRIDAIIPGYGFLSENVDFARRVTEAGMVFAGPSPESISEMGLKHRARHIAVSSGLPVIPGTDLLSTENEALQSAQELDFPVMLKATGGGGGMGLQICYSPDEVSSAFSNVQSRGEALFKNSGLFIEKFYPRSRHIEVQIFGNGQQVIHFGERECSIQRRHQKVIEESPSPFVEARPGLRERLTSCATRYASALNYKSAGTVEFLVDDDTGDFFFLEMNTRLQVEHGITELCYQVDLVALMLRQADYEMAGQVGIPSSELLMLQRDGPVGSAIEGRVYAEAPAKGFAPCPGLLQEVSWPTDPDFRVDTWVQSGQQVTPFYDPLLAKVIVHTNSRQTTIEKMSSLISTEVRLKGLTTNLDYINSIIKSDSFARGATLTSYLDKTFKYNPPIIEVLTPGTFTTIQDLRGRHGIGHGIPRRGPMDSISSRIANILVGNDAGTEVLEVLLSGPEVSFSSDAVISVCGAKALITIDGIEKPMWSRQLVRAGQILRIGFVSGSGCRLYLAVKGGFPDIPLTFGSKSTTPSLKFGGIQGRQLQTGDLLTISEESAEWARHSWEYTLPSDLHLSSDIKEIYVMQGPHDSDDIMTAQDREMLYSASWKIGHNSNRSGIRLTGPKPEWARKHGGAGGAHPSNYLDYGYPSPGGVNWGGDFPVIFSNDSPNIGGLICSSTVVSADLWKLGQLAPDADIKMVPVSYETAVGLAAKVDSYLLSVTQAVKQETTVSVGKGPNLNMPSCLIGGMNAVLKFVEAAGPQRPKVIYRQGGDCFILIEFGEQVPDITIIARVRLLVEKLQAQQPSLLLTPHISCLTVEFNPQTTSRETLLSSLVEIETSIELSMDMKIPCREFRLPVVMDHPAIAECIQRYMETTRSKAVYLPDNLEYLRKANGIDTRREVFNFVPKNEFLVVAVGFLSGAPMMYPLTSRGLVGQKYNPTRVSTPSGTLGLAGSILSGYPVEQPGGYMMLARTLPMWDTYGTKPGFSNQKPWIFEPFDLIKFYEVSIEEYDRLEGQFLAGKYRWDMSHSTFNLRAAYEKLHSFKADADHTAYLERQKSGLAEQVEIEKRFHEEWQAAMSHHDVMSNGETENQGGMSITSPMAAKVWKVEVKVGDVLESGTKVAVLEAMKMEVSVYASEEHGGATVASVVRQAGATVKAGEPIIAIEIV